MNRKASSTVLERPLQKYKSGVKNRIAPANRHLAHVQLKLLLMAAIDEGVRRRFGTLQEAANTAGIDRALLSRVRHGDHRRCSIASLLCLAEELHVHIKIDVQLV